MNLSREQQARGRGGRMACQRLAEAHSSKNKRKREERVRARSGTKGTDLRAISMSSKPTLSSASFSAATPASHRGSTLFSTPNPCSLCPVCTTHATRSSRVAPSPNSHLPTSSLAPNASYCPSEPLRRSPSSPPAFPADGTRLSTARNCRVDGVLLRADTR
eukprot:605308-Rhodomonas_salina.2